MGPAQNILSSGGNPKKQEPTPAPTDQTIVRLSTTGDLWKISGLIGDSFSPDEMSDPKGFVELWGERLEQDHGIVVHREYAGGPMDGEVISAMGIACHIDPDSGKDAATAIVWCGGLDPGILEEAYRVLRSRGISDFCIPTKGGEAIRDLHALGFKCVELLFQKKLL